MPRSSAVFAQWGGGALRRVAVPYEVAREKNTSICVLLLLSCVCRYVCLLCYNGVYSASVAACVRTTVPYCACHLMCLTYGQYHPDASSASQCGANPPIGEGDLAIAIRATDLFPASDLFAPAFCRDELGWGWGFAEYGRMPESMREQYYH